LVELNGTGYSVCEAWEGVWGELWPHLAPPGNWPIVFKGTLWIFFVCANVYLCPIGREGIVPGSIGWVEMG